MKLTAHRSKILLPDIHNHTHQIRFGVRSWQGPQARLVLGDDPQRLLSLATIILSLEELCERSKSTINVAAGFLVPENIARHRSTF